MLSRSTGRGGLLPLFAVLATAVWALSGPAATAQFTPRGRSVSPTARANNQATVAQIKAQLKQAGLLLKSADRDYGGHRARAAAALRKAMHTLVQHNQQNGQRAQTGQVAGQQRPFQQGQGQQGQGQQRPGQQVPGQAGQGQVPPGNNLTQAQSDGQLKQAAQAINTAMSLMSGVTVNSRTTAAMPLLQQAVQEIQLALNYSQQHPQQQQQQNPIVPPR
jgi:hypothetical protein